MGFVALALMAEADAGEGSGGGGGQPSAATPPAGSVLGNVAGAEFIPEKYRTNKEDGSLDLEASSRKVAEAYKHLETRMGSGDAPPKTVDEYSVKLEGVEGFNWDEFKADENSRSFLKGAHAKGLTNDQVSFVIGEYLKAAPGLIQGDAAITQQDCAAALKAVWGDDQTMQTNLKASYSAAQAFASEEGKPGSFQSLMAKYGNDPDFIAFTANIGKELREDSQISGGTAISDGDFDVKSAELRKQLQELPAHDPRRKGVQEQLNSMYDARFNKNSRLR